MAEVAPKVVTRKEGGGWSEAGRRAVPGLCHANTVDAGGRSGTAGGTATRAFSGKPDSLVSFLSPGKFVSPVGEEAAVAFWKLTYWYELPFWLLPPCVPLQICPRCFSDKLGWRWIMLSYSLITAYWCVFVGKACPHSQPLLWAVCQHRFSFLLGHFVAHFVSFLEIRTHPSNCLQYS